jgi:nucleotide-binding universal stress UspA family protein
MMSIKKILCPVDFFPASDAAVTYAAGLAANYGAGVHLLHVVTSLTPFAYEYPIDTTDLLKSVEHASIQKMKPLVATVANAGVPVESEVRIGDVYDEIKYAIGTLKPDLVVMGTHGRRSAERWFMGSTTEKLLRHSPVPVLTIRAPGEDKVVAPRFRHILVTTDFSSGTADAVAYAFSLAKEHESKVTLLHVVHLVAADLSAKYSDGVAGLYLKDLEALVPPEAKKWCDVATKVENGVPYRVILQTLETEKIDLVVMNIHGKGMLDRALLGSTADRVVRAAPCPVLMIPPLKKKQKRRARPGGNRVVA